MSVVRVKQQTSPTFAASYGMFFPVSSGTYTARFLDDGNTEHELIPVYEEGTWTPFSGDDGLNWNEGQTYSIQSGYYVKIGAIVWYWGAIYQTSYGTMTTTQQFRICGLPYIPKTTAGIDKGTGCIHYCAGASMIAGDQMALEPHEENAIRVWRISGAGGHAINIADMTTGFELVFGGCYLTNVL